MQVGTYQLLESIGEGVSSRVFRARSAAGELCAVKRFVASPSQANAERFAREVSALRKVSHASLVRCLDQGVDEDGSPFLVMELVEGKTLAALAKDGPLLPEEALAFLLPVLDALQALHEAGFVHRDVKPANILLTEEGRVVLADLGSAFSDDASRLTAEGAVTGTVPYMAPEQIDGGAVSTSVDLWAVAVVFYELIAGRRPFYRALANEEVAAILRGDFAPLSRASRAATVHLSELVRRCLSRSANERPSTALLLRGELLASVSLTEEDASRIRVAITRSDAATLRVLRASWAARTLSEANREIQQRSRFTALKALDRALFYGVPNTEVAPLVEVAKALQTREEEPLRRRRTRWMLFALAALAVSIFLLQKYNSFRTQAVPTAATSTPVTEAAFLPFAEAALPNASLGLDTSPARRSFDRASSNLRLHPRSSDTRLERARALIQLGRLRDAQRDALVVYETEPQNVKAMRVLVVICDRMGDSARALPLLRAIVRVDPANATAWTDLSIAEPDARVALDAVTRALRLSPSSPRPLRRACSLLVHAHDAHALAMCERAVRASPRDAYAHLDLANARQEAHDIGGAITAASRAVALRPGEAAFAEQLARLRALTSR